VTAPVCPGCGAPLTVPRTGRRPRWCSKPCRQAAYRARLAAERAAGDAAWVLGQIAAAHAELTSAAAGLEMAYGQATVAAAEAGDDLDMMLGSGYRWEMRLHDAAADVSCQRSWRMVTRCGGTGGELPSDLARMWCLR
jgi:hypothetical protein